jgi:hypothetical protein
VHAKALRVAIAPSGPFSEGGFNLAMPPENSTIAADEQQRAIHGSLGHRIAFDNSNYHVHTGCFRCCTELVRCWTWDLNRARDVFSKRFECQRLCLGKDKKRIPG